METTPRLANFAADEPRRIDGAYEREQLQLPGTSVVEYREMLRPADHRDDLDLEWEGVGVGVGVVMNSISAKVQFRPIGTQTVAAGLLIRLL